MAQDAKELLLKCLSMNGRLHSDANLLVIANQFTLQGDISQGETLLLANYVQKKRRTFQMVDWSGQTNSFGTGNRSLRYCVQDDHDSIEGEAKRSGAGLLNSKSALDLCERIDLNFDRLYAKRAFVWRYVG